MQVHSKCFVAGLQNETAITLFFKYIFDMNMVIWGKKMLNLTIVHNTNVFRTVFLK